VPALRRALGNSTPGLRAAARLATCCNSWRVEAFKPPKALSYRLYANAWTSREPQSLFGRSEPNKICQRRFSSSGLSARRLSTSETNFSDSPSDNERLMCPAPSPGAHTHCSFRAGQPVLCSPESLPFSDSPSDNPRRMAKAKTGHLLCVISRVTFSLKGPLRP
jgi:hypothetical protein